MQKYWINQDGVQSGPFTQSELKSVEITDETYVWRSGLEGWLKMEELPEYDEIFNAPEPEPEPEVAVEESTAEPEVSEEVAVEEAVLEPSESSENSEPAEIEATPPATELPPPVPPHLFEASFGQPKAVQVAAQPAKEEKPKCPPSNLVWAIIATVLFTTILGIIAIVYAVKVKKKYNRNDLAGAERCSNRGAWWCIGSIVAHFLLMPVSMLLSFL